MKTKRYLTRRGEELRFDGSSWVDGEMTLPVGPEGRPTDHLGQEVDGAFLPEVITTMMCPLCGTRFPADHSIPPHQYGARTCYGSWRGTGLPATTKTLPTK